MLGFLKGRLSELLIYVFVVFAICVVGMSCSFVCSFVVFGVWNFGCWTWAGIGDLGRHWVSGLKSGDWVDMSGVWVDIGCLD